MKNKISSERDVRKLRSEFRKQYNKFSEDFNKLAIDADLLLGAMEEIIKYGNEK